MERLFDEKLKKFANRTSVTTTSAQQPINNLTYQNLDNEIKEANKKITQNTNRINFFFPGNLGNFEFIPQGKYDLILSLVLDQVYPWLD